MLSKIQDGGKTDAVLFSAPIIQRPLMNAAQFGEGGPTILTKVPECFFQQSPLRPFAQENT